MKLKKFIMNEFIFQDGKKESIKARISPITKGVNKISI
jgi:hypothetical protein